MALTITEAFVQQYKGNVIHLSQQKASRLAGSVRTESITGKRHFFERLAKTAAVKRTTRHGDTPLVMSVHSRRAVSLVDYEWADLVDQADKIRLLINPQSEYAMNAAKALERAKDDEIIAAFGGSAWSGETGGTEVVFDTSNQEIVVGAASMTLAKLLEAKEMLDAADVDPDEPRYIVLSPQEMTALLNTTEVKSADYNSVKALVQGQLNSFMGFEFILSNRLGVASDGDRYCYAWARSGMALAMGQDIVTRITERDDKSYSTQVFVSGTFGATRVEDEKVVRIICNI